MIFLTGGTGLLGSALCKEFPTALHPTRGNFNLLDEHYPAWMREVTLAFLCAGTKGHAECEGDRIVFRADVDGNIRLGRYLHRWGAFVVFISTDAVECTLNTAYARNRMLVELALGSLPGVAIVRPGRFTAEKARELAKLCAYVGTNKLEGLHRWP